MDSCLDSCSGQLNFPKEFPEGSETVEKHRISFLDGSVLILFVHTHDHLDAVGRKNTRLPFLAMRLPTFLCVFLHNN
jgi:hypothetical protein